MTSWDHPALEHLGDDGRGDLAEEGLLHLRIALQDLDSLAAPSADLGWPWPLAFSSHNCSQVEFWYFAITFWAISSRMGKSCSLGQAPKAKRRHQHWQESLEHGSSPLTGSGSKTGRAPGPGTLGHPTSADGLRYYRQPRAHRRWRESWNTSCAGRLLERLHIYFAIQAKHRRQAEAMTQAASRGKSPGHRSGRTKSVSAFPGDIRVRTVLQVRAVAGELGLDFPILLAAAGAEPDSFDDPEARLPIDVIGRLLEACVERTECTHFGLMVGRRFDPSQLGELGSMMKNCASVREALTLGTRHMQVADRGAMSFMLDVGDGRTALGYALFAGIIPGAEYIQDCAIAMQCQLLRALCGPAWRPLLVRLSRARPADLRPYRTAFGDNVEFDADLAAIVFDSRCLDQPIAGARRDAFLAAARAVDLKESSDPVTFTRQVRRAIHALLFSSSASTPKIARLFDLAPRTLRRRLAEEGSTVRDLTGDVRREVSFHLLRNTRLKLSEIAAALRYADAAVFSRAFRSWTGSSPRKWRAIQARDR